MRIRKVKVSKKDGKVEIMYETRTKDDKWNTATISSYDDPANSFFTPLRDLPRFVVEMCEFPGTYKDRILVSGVSFSYGGDTGIMGAVIIAQLGLIKTNAKLNILTPHKSEDFQSGGDTGDDSQLLPDDCVPILYTLISECEKYIEGFRSQIKMFDSAKAVVGDKS